MTDNLNERIGITEIPVLMQWIRSRCKGVKRVKFDPEAATAYVTADGMIVIPMLSAKMTKRDAIRLRGLCLHETGHPRYQPDVWDIMKANPVPMTHPLAGIYNMVLDVHNETSNANEWPGDAKALSELGVVTGRDVTDRVKAAPGTDLDEDMVKTMAAMKACIDAESQWNVGLSIGFRELFDSHVPAEVLQIADDLENRFDLSRRLIDTDNENEYTLWDLAKEMFNFLWPDKDADEEVSKEKERREKGKGEKSEDGEGGEPGEEGEDGERGSSGDSPDEGNSGENPDGEGKPCKKLKVTDLLRTEHYEDGSSGHTGVDQTFDYSDYTEYNEYVPVDFSKFQIIDFEGK